METRSTPRCALNVSFSLLSALALIACFAFQNRLHASLWPEINKAELAEQKPQVDPEAGAEILLKKIYMDQSSWFGYENDYYYRVKIFNQRGVEKFSKVDIEYGDGTSVDFIAARTITPNGTIVELDQTEIFTRTLVKTDGLRVNVKSFAPLALEPGVILEYRFSRVSKHSTTWSQLEFQSEVPIRLVKYQIKLLPVPGYDVCALSFNCPNQPLQLSPAGECSFEMANLKAYTNEPFQLPTINRAAGIILFLRWFGYTEQPSDEYWSTFSRKWFKEIDHRAKPNQSIRAALSGLISQNDTADAKLRKIYDFCRSKIINRERDNSPISKREAAKLKENQTAADVLSAGSGTHDDINLLFASLARAAGIETKFAFCNNRARVNYNPKLTIGLFMMGDLVVAARLPSGDWKYFDPGTAYLPYSTLRWQNCDTMVIHCDENGAPPIPLKGPAADESELYRKADLKVDAEGTLEGTVTETYSGYLESALKDLFDGKGSSEQEKIVQEHVTDYQPSAELTHITIENASAPVGPLKVSYRLRIPNYAGQTTSRLILQPAVFQKGVPPVFTADTRENMLMFTHRYTHHDEIRITPPPGFATETASTPGGVDMNPVGYYLATLQSDPKTNCVTYDRVFKISSLTFAKKYYSRIKGMFDEVQQKDTQTISLINNASTN
ncbi:MAG: DUF3857 and transglutaminase domain-containing protein [Nibricoccus sp.]